VRAGKREQRRLWQQALKVRNWPRMRQTVIDGVELRPLTAHDIRPFYQSIDTARWYYHEQSY